MPWRHSSTVWAVGLGFLALPFVALVLPAWHAHALLIAWAIVVGVLLARVWTRPGGRYVVFVYSESPNWQQHVETDILPRLPEHAAILDWSDRARWPFWSLSVWLFTLRGGYGEFNPLGIVWRRWRFPRVFRFWRAFRDAKHGNPTSLIDVQRRFFAAAGPGPSVRVHDERPAGASLSWTGPRARDVALRILVELARRLEDAPSIVRLRLDGEVGEPIDVATVDEFVTAVPALLTRLYAGFTFTFRLNDGDGEYRVAVLDRRAHGIRFQTPEENEAFWDIFGDVLREFAMRAPNVRVSGTPWYDDAAPFR